MAIQWVETADLSIRQSAREVGFDIAQFENFPKDVQETVKSRSINRLIKSLDTIWLENLGLLPNSASKSFREINRGIYILTLSNNLCVQYPKDVSRVLYIGKGAVRLRLDSHFKNSLFDFSRSLKDIDFKFYFCEPKKQKSLHYYHDFETDLLNRFREKYGDRNQLYPLLNYNAGRSHDNAHTHGSGWDNPLKNYKKKYTWILKPTTHANWPKKLRDR